MIIIKIQGGLGNQLFQYALGRTIEKKYKKEVKYDTSFFDIQQKFTPRVFLLDKFNTEIKIASDSEVKKAKGFLNYYIKKTLNKFLIKKYHIAYEPDYLESIGGKDSKYLEGYWQSSRYVEPSIPELKKEIVLENETQQFKKISEEISNSESVAMHIRRGDYLNTGGGLEVLDISYYEEANNFISEKIKDIKYYIFTDDVTWAKENLGFLGKDNVVYASDLGLNDYEELVLMSQCKHLIIANSSFSWWGAVLNDNKDPIIICPQDWKNALLKNDENLCPKEWVRI